ncbi:leucine-rich repeat protein [Acetobacterium sp.]|uniref:leucine-rich repeat protein n=1 Tax=Acetobacterium sp. TaxID=1872094 RepID=UPI0035931F36
MKKGFKQGLSGLLMLLLITGLVPVGVMAEQTSESNVAPVKQEVAVPDNNGAVAVSGANENDVSENQPILATRDEVSDAATNGDIKETIAPQELQTSATDPNYTYYDTTGGVYIYRYTGTGGDVTIPATLGGKKVVGIAGYSFQVLTITSVVIPEGVTYIDAHGFDDCSSLKTITIPESMKTIGDYAFENCESLTAIKIPKDLINLGNHVFEGCLSLVRIEVAAENLKFSSIEGLLYNKGGDKLLACPGGVATVTTPSSVTTIAPYAFAACTNLANVVLNDGVITIDDYAFSDCTNLMKINIPEGVTRIGTYAFNNCNNLMVIITPKSATNIGTYAFAGCDNLINLTFGEGITRIPEYAFQNCSSLSTVKLPESLTGIGGYAFQDCTNLSAIAIPNNVLNIGSMAFANCGLVTITIPQNVVTIGSSAFSGCTSLTTVNLVEGLTTIDNSAFYNCNNLRSISIPKTVIRIGGNAFYGCASIATMSIPDGVAVIDDNAFGNCASLTGISIPQSVQSIGSGVFDGCLSLKSITVSADNPMYSSVNGMLFNSNGANLVRCPEGATSFVIPAGVTSIGDAAFYQCANLASINIPEGVTSIGYLAFGDCTHLVKVIIPETVTAMGSYVFRYSGNLTIYGAAGSYAQTYANNYGYLFVSSGYFKVSSFTADKTSGQYVDTDINLIAVGVGGTAPYQYKFYYRLGTEEKVIRDYLAAETAIFKPAAPGTYTLFVDIKDKNGNIVSRNISDYAIFSNPYVSSFTTDKASGQGTNTDIKLTAIGAGGVAPYQYKFYYRLGTTNNFISDFTVGNTAIFKPQAVGTYTLYVEMKDANEKAVTSSIGNYVIVKPVAPVNLKTSEISNNSATLAWDAVVGASSYNVYKNGVKVNADPITGTSFKVEGLTAKSEYTFTVKSLVNAIESEASTGTKIKTMGEVVNLSVGTVTGAPGKNVIVKVDVSNNSTISAARFIVGFDNAKLEYLGTNAGTMAQGGTIVTNLAGNQVTIGYINQKMLTEAGAFLELEFKIKEGMADQSLPITLTSLELTDLTGFELIPVVSNGAIKISGIIMGDINGDGMISAYDALMALQIATGKIVPTATQKTAADIDGNGMASAFESLRILQFATGKTTVL